MVWLMGKRVVVVAFVTLGSVCAVAGGITEFQRLQRQRSIDRNASDAAHIALVTAAESYGKYDEYDKEPTDKNGVRTFIKEHVSQYIDSQVRIGAIRSGDEQATVAVADGLIEPYIAAAEFNARDAVRHAWTKEKEEAPKSARREFLKDSVEDWIDKNVGEGDREVVKAVADDLIDQGNPLKAAFDATFTPSTAGGSKDEVSAYKSMFERDVTPALPKDVGSTAVQPNGPVISEAPAAPGPGSISSGYGPGGDNAGHTRDYAGPDAHSVEVEHSATIAER
jgi:hypothetical protein